MEQVQPNPVQAKINMEVLYELFDDLTIEQLKELINDIQQEIDLRNYKATRVIKIKELMDKERERLKKEYEAEKIKFKEQWEKDKNKMRLRGVQEEEESEEESEEAPKLKKKAAKKTKKK